MDKNQVAELLLSHAINKGADKAQCVVTDQITTEIYYEQGKIGLLRTIFNNTVALKVIKDKQKGTVGANSFEGLDRLAEDALQNAKSATPDDAEDICDERRVDSFVYGSLEPDRDAMYDGLVKFISDAKAQFPKISFDSITIEHVKVTRLYQNTNGVRLEETRGFYVFSPMFMALDNGNTSSFNASEAVFLDAKQDYMSLGLTRQLLKETEQQVETTVLDGKFTGSLIVTPPCLEDILSTVEGNFLSDGVLMNNTSLFKNKLGKQVASENVSVYAQPLNKSLAGGYFVTGDGYVAENMPLIENGTLKNFVLSRYGAAKTGKERSKNEGGCYVMTPGTKTLDEIIASTKKGVLLNRFSGGSPGVDGDITGVAKNSFLIEDGKITAALSETMISANLASMLMNISEISSDTVENGDFILPYVKIDNVTISGK